MEPQASTVMDIDATVLASRGSVKSSTLKLVTRQADLEGFLDTCINDLQRFDRPARGLLEAQREEVQGLWDQFKVSHFKILEDPHNHTLSYILEGRCDIVKRKFSDALNCIYTAFERESPRQACTPASSLTAPSVQLPRITLPRFNGDYVAWESFRDMFVSLIHNNPTLTDVQRLHYLRTNLSGEALDLIDGSPITDEEYAGAWKSLRDRYENKRVLIFNHLDKFVNLPSLRKDSAADLKALRDNTAKLLRSIGNLGRSEMLGNDLCVYLTVKRFDPILRKEWEKSLGDITVPPTFEDLTKFIDVNIRALETANTTNPSTVPSAASRSSATTKNRFVGTRTHLSTANSRTSRSCPACQGQHYIGYCTQFKQRTPEQRRDLAVQLQLCTNCLTGGHTPKGCKSERKCLTCNQSHHTLLHRNQTSAPSATHLSKLNGTEVCPEPPKASTSSDDTSPVVSHHAGRQAQYTASTVLLATALVTLTSPEGRRVTIRALLDQGSETSFISEAIVQQLRLKRNRVQIPILGIGSAHAGTARSYVQVDLWSRIATVPSVAIKALVLPQLTRSLLPSPVQEAHWPHLDGLPLADPTESAVRDIDLILGADIYGQLLLHGVRKGPVGTPCAQNTILGWILFGPITAPISNRSTLANTCSSVTAFHSITDSDTSQLLKRFWELEEVEPTRIQTPDDVECEQHFRSTHRRNTQGRYIVRLPFKQDPQLMLRDSKSIATKQLLRLERRFVISPNLRKDYSDFMSEYHTLGHMEPVPMTSNQTDQHHSYFMPHHAVLRSDSLTTKIRVVFNASQSTTSGYSLNDCLHVGPSLQKELYAVILKWRTHRFVFMADIEKMYRQIAVHPEDADYQRVLWRESTVDTIQEYRLITVTYGTAAAPYLAIRTLRQLAEDEREQYPFGAKVLQNDFYVDDLLSGADDMHTACLIQDELNQILRAGGFTLRKWVANHEDLIARIPVDLRQQTLRTLSADEHVRALGLTWNPTTDQFQFRVKIPTDSGSSTKRTVLSTIARLFDPLGWVTPVIIRAKILLQQLWLARIDWDDPLPIAIETDWTHYRQGLHAIEEIPISRWVGTHRQQIAAEVHGFADASQHAYAAVVYLRVTDRAGKTHVTLVAAKSKVAPLKVISIPRLELCGAVLLIRLLRAVIQAMDLQHLPLHAWTDSRVVLAWLKGHPTRWTCFVANRVSELQTTLPETIWHHVRSADNPADCASRGMTPTELRMHNLWWHGPQWLIQHQDQWPSTTNLSLDNDPPEARKPVHIHLAQEDDWSLARAYSKLTKLLRVTALCQRFARNLRVPPDQRSFRVLSTHELANARTFWIKKVQSEAFSEDITLMRDNKPLPRRSQLRTLTPFLDQEGVLRVGGRLRNAPLPFEEKHPAILPKRAHLSSLLVDAAHTATLHGGTQLTLSYLLRRVWILGGSSLVRSHLHRCTTCCRFKAHAGVQKMGDLPPSRIIPSRPFSRTGLDYAGPIQLRTTKGRGHRSYKGFIALFICLATKAVHLEVVSDYSTQTFLAAFKRFTARRGICTELLSDNGSNFKGADSELRSMFRASSRYWSDLATLLANDGTHWTFIPPAAPHFGGLWEAGVKATKFHLKRVIGHNTLTYEEMATLLTQIEACLNSRPISPLSCDPQDLTALTPGHFLIGTAPTTVPEPGTLEIPTNRLSRWQLIQNMQEHFWTRWSKEYLHHLQQRNKWFITSPNLQPGMLAILKDERLPPSKWPLARITEIHPGQDGLVRVVTVRTSSATLKRPITKLCPLPIEAN